MDAYAARPGRPSSKLAVFLYLFVLGRWVSERVSVTCYFFCQLFHTVSFESLVSVLVEDFHDRDHCGHTLRCISYGGLGGGDVSRSRDSPVVGGSARIARRNRKSYNFRRSDYRGGYRVS